MKEFIPNTIVITNHHDQKTKLILFVKDLRGISTLDANRLVEEAMLKTPFEIKIVKTRYCKEEYYSMTNEELKNHVVNELGFELPNLEKIREQYQIGEDVRLTIDIKTLSFISTSPNFNIEKNGLEDAIKIQEELSRFKIIVDKAVSLLKVEAFKQSKRK